ncbi:uncharacterized protein LOC144104104 isoform X2 [Amblyomma americanum]
MPPGSMQYRLVGFAPELDWRPLHFLKPLPPNRVCSACGLVRQKTALLSCAHTLCESCYGQCAEAGLHVCPLDGYECQDEDIICVDFPAEDLLRRGVMCWNAGAGCEYVAPASRIAQHFQSDCGHHSVDCLKCSDSVPCCNVIPHLRNCCCNSANPAASDGDAQSGSWSTVDSDCSLNETFEKQFIEVKEFLGQIVSQISAHGDRLDEISLSINNVTENQQHEAKTQVEELHRSFTQIMSKMEESNEELKSVLASRSDTTNVSKSMDRLEKTLKYKIDNEARHTQRQLSENASAIEAAKAAAQESIEFSANTLVHVKSIMPNTELNNALCVFLVKDVKSLQEKALTVGFAEYESEPVHLRGYNLSPGVYLKKDGDSVKLYVWLCLYKGNMDDLVKWPFDHKIKLSVVHDIKRATDRVLEVHARPFYSNLQKPTTYRNWGMHIAPQSLEVEDLIKDGYVENNQLLVMFEILP